MAKLILVYDQHGIPENDAGMHIEFPQTIEEIYKICTKLNDGQIAVVEAQEQLLLLFSVSRFSTEPKLVKCDNCDEMVEMISTGEFCPCCFC